MRIVIAICLVLLTLAGPADAQADANFYVGAWRDMPIDRAPANRIVLHRVDIEARPTLRPPQQFTIRMWARCADRPEAGCLLGTVAGVARTLRDGAMGIYVDGTPSSREPRLACPFNLLLVPAYIPSDPENPESRKAGIDYRITRSSGACAGPPLAETLGALERIPVLAPLPVPPTEPRLPPRRF